MSSVDDWAELLRADARAVTSAATGPARKFTWQLDLPIVEADFTRWGPLLRSFNDAAAQIGKAPPSVESALGVARQLSPLPPFDEQAANTQRVMPMTQLLKHRKTWLTHATSLAINKVKQEILDGARSSRVLLVVGDVGSGKSTQLPQYLAAMEKKKRLIVVASNDNAASLLAARLAAESGEPVALATSISTPLSSAAVVVATADVLLRALFADPYLSQVSAVVIDDVQNKTMMLEVLLTALKHALFKETTTFRLVLNCASHNPHTERLMSDYFSSVGLKKVQIPAVHSDTRATEMSLEDVVQWVTSDGLVLPQDSSSVTEAPPTLQSIAETEKLKKGQPFDCGSSFIDEWIPFILAAVRKYSSAAIGTGIAADQSAIAVILPTELHCQLAVKALSQDGSYQVASWGFNSDIASNADAYSADASKRLVVVAVARAYVGALAPTVPFGFVIDSGREGVTFVDPSTHVSKKSLEVSSKLALKMRKDTVASASKRTPHRPIIATLLTSDALRKVKPQPTSTAQSTSAEEWRDACLVMSCFAEDWLQTNTAAMAASGSYTNRVLTFCTPSGDEFRQQSQLVGECCTCAESWITASGLLLPALDATSRRVVSNLGRLCASFPLPIVVSKLIVTASVVGLPEAGAVLAASLLSGGVTTPLSHAEAEDCVAARKYASSTATTVSDVLADLRLLKLLDGQGKRDDLPPHHAERVQQCCSALVQCLRQRGVVDAAPSDSWSVEPHDEELLSFCFATAVYPNAGFAPLGKPSALVVPDAGACDVQAAPRPHLHASACNATSFEGAPQSVPLTFVEAFVPGQSRLPVVAGLHQTEVVTASLAAANARLAGGDKPQSEIQQRRSVKTSRCRGWWAPVTTSWRETKIAQACITSEASQIKPKPIPTKLCDVTQADTTILAMDSVMNLAVPSPTAHFVDKARIGIRVSYADAVAALSRSTCTASATPSSRIAAHSEFIELLRWMLRRENSAQSYSRERRRLNSNAPAKLRLLSAFPFSYLASDMPARRPQEDFADVALVHDEGVGQGVVNFAGAVPTDAETLAFINKAAKLTADLGNRDKEKDLLLSAPEKFGFLDFKHPFHGFYLAELKKLNPNIKVLGDDLNELRDFLTQLEKTIQDEMDGNRRATVELPREPAFVAPVASRPGVRVLVDADRDLQQPHRPQPAPQPTISGGTSSIFFNPDSKELPPPVEMAPTPAPAWSLGPGGGLMPAPSAPFGFGPPGPQQQTSEGLLDPGTHPLAIPPPPVPIDPNADPSVLIYPLPELRVATSDPLPLIIAKALGETFNLKVGPTLIVGSVARVTVPNRAVESRAIAKGSFFCLGQKCKIVKNDRIFDNPALLQLNKAKHDYIRRSLQTDVPRHLKRVAYSPERAPESSNTAEGQTPAQTNPAAPPPAFGSMPQFGMIPHHLHHHHAHQMPHHLHHHHLHHMHHMHHAHHQHHMHHHHHHHHAFGPPVVPNMGYAVVGAEGSLGGGPMVGGRRRPAVAPQENGSHDANGAPPTGTVGSLGSI